MDFLNICFVLGKVSFPYICYLSSMLKLSLKHGLNIKPDLAENNLENYLFYGIFFQFYGIFFWINNKT